MGDGKFLSFWTDIWACEMPLQMKFPRIFALVVKKTCMTADFGVYCNNLWRWNIQIRRRLFHWEIPIWNFFQSLLFNFQSFGLEKNWIKWLGSGDGLFSPKSLKISTCPSFHFICQLGKIAWIGFAPHKVEAFVWLLLHGRVLVKTEIDKRGIIPSPDALCPFCTLETWSP
ncbi:hypothetical protein GQ457_03G020160 [Hibiscus cannabinus]